MSSDRRENGDEERDRIDELRQWLDARYRRVARLVIAMMVLGLLAFVAGGLMLRAQQQHLSDQQRVATEQRADILRQQAQIVEGRRLARRVVCSAVSAVIDAGRATITGGAAPGPPAFTHALERLGYPPLAKRRVAARQAADGYANLIATSIAKASGVRGLVKPDGSLDCDRFERVTGP